MKRPLFTLLAVFSCAAMLRADLVVTQKIEGAGQGGEVVQKLKGDKIRTDLPRDVSTITDTATGDVFTLMHGQKSYLRIPAAQTRAMIDKMQQLAGSHNGGQPPKLQPTNRKEKVGEWDTEVFTTKIGALEITYWVAKAFPNYAPLLEQMMKLQQSGSGTVGKNLGPDPKEFPGMPVKTEMNLNGKKITSTIVSVKEEPVSDAVFELPKDYKEIELPETPAAPAPAK